MQTELEAESPELNIQIIGINEIGHEAANDLITDGRDLPWLQDVDLNSDGQSDIWDTSWGVEFRDVIVVDASNKRLGAFNLTSNSLEAPENYDLLKQTVMHVATENPIWQNDADPLDVNNDSVISPVGDVLTVVNELNNRAVSDSVGNLPVPARGGDPPPYFDVNGDYVVSPVGDALTLVNHLNSAPPSGVGEGPVRRSPDYRLLRTTDATVEDAVKNQDFPGPALLEPASPIGRGVARAAMAAIPEQSRACWDGDDCQDDWFVALAEDLVSVWN